MTIGIIVAMDKEFSLFKEMLHNPQEIILDGFSYNVGKINEIKIVLVKCGVGKVNASLGTISLIRYFTPHCIISTGVAGGLSSDLKPLDVVIATGCAYHDVDCGNEIKKGQVQGLPQIFKTNEELVYLASNVVKSAHCGLLVSGDRFVKDDSEKKRILDIYPKAIAVDMESCAIAQTCYKCDKPFFAVRIISDMCKEGEYYKMWENLMHLSIDTIPVIIQNLCKKMNKKQDYKIASFTVDHSRLKRGVYVSRKDKFGDEFITTFDIRMKEPYKDKCLNQGAAHTIEHIGATYLRNAVSIKDDIVYWGPMGCLTGFYLIVHGDLSPNDILPYLRQLFIKVVESEEIPGNSKKECGNCGLHDLSKAKEEALSYLGVLINVKDENTHYPL